jgi:hypothetical protein
MIMDEDRKEKIKLLASELLEAAKVSQSVGMWRETFLEACKQAWVCAELTVKKELEAAG